MTKYTKRQYQKDLAAVAAAIEAVKIELSSFADRAEAGEDVNAMSEAWNAAHDRQYELECEQHEIERRFARRDWSYQDYVFADLVAQNID